MSSPLKQNTTTIQELLNTINNLPEAGTDLPELSNEGSAADLLNGKQLIDGDGNVVTGTIATKTKSDLTASGATVTVPAGYYASQATKIIEPAAQAIPSIIVDSNGLITASTNQSAGYVTAGIKSSTKQLLTKGTKTITPTKYSQIAVPADVYITGDITVAAIPSEYITTTDATASADEIMSGETAYVNGSKVTGTFSIDSELTAQDDLIAQIQAAVDSLPEAGGSNINIETVTIQLSSMTPGGVSGTLYYTDKTNNLQSLVATAGQVEVLKNTLMLAINGGEGITSSGLPIIYYSAGTCTLFQATQDGIINL